MVRFSSSIHHPRLVPVLSFVDRSFYGNICPVILVAFWQSENKVGEVKNLTAKLSLLSLRSRMTKSIHTKEYVKELTKKHEGKWIAISPNYKKIVGFSKTLKDLKDKVKDDGVIFSKVLMPSISYSF